MDRETYDQQFEQFDAACRMDGRFSEIEKLPVINEDAPQHTDRDYTADYLIHCSWAADMLGKYRPTRHIDFGSYVYFAALCKAFIPQFAFYDIRAFGVEIESLATGIADLMDLPFSDRTQDSISCLHVMEHVGMGRYGDKLDVAGDRKAAWELTRILNHGGTLLMVSPLNEQPRCCFNAHRIYSEEMLFGMFPEMNVVERFYIDGSKVIPRKLASGDYTGCYLMQRM